MCISSVGVDTGACTGGKLTQTYVHTLKHTRVMQEKSEYDGDTGLMSMS